MKPAHRKAMRLARLAPVLAFSLALGIIAACGGRKTSPGFGPAGGGGGDGDGGSDDAGVLSFGDDSGFGSPLMLDGSIPMGTPVGDAGCATAMSQAHFAAAYLLFVLDGSGSMNQNNKWTAVVPALKDIFSQMSMSADNGLAAGLIIFSDTMDSTAGAGPYPSSADVPLGLVNAAQNTKLAGRLSGNPMSGTPTQTAMTGGYTELESFQAPPDLTGGGKKVLVLITDGAPTDGCSILSSVGSTGYTSNPCVQMASQKLMEAAPKGPIETFVIGVGQFPSAIALTFDPSFLGYVAQAGGTGPAKCNPSENSTTSDLCYFEIDPSKATTAMQLQQQFETALNTIRGEVASCNFPIQSSGSGAIDPSKVNVEIGGKTILQDPANGWTYDNPTKPTEIVLHGAACSAAKGDITEKVQVVLGCKTQTIPM
ncbi:MAG: vWA domain-containing protein [Polyangiaceae bacterium]